MASKFKKFAVICATGAIGAGFGTYFLMDDDFDRRVRRKPHNFWVYEKEPISISC